MEGSFQPNEQGEVKTNFERTHPLVSKKGTKRDPTLQCNLIQIYRDVVHFYPNHIQRQYIVEKVSCCERGQRLWRATLSEFMLEGKNPRNVAYMVKIWENQFWDGSQVGGRPEFWTAKENANSGTVH